MVKHEIEVDRWACAYRNNLPDTPWIGHGHSCKRYTIRN